MRSLVVMLSRKPFFRRSACRAAMLPALLLFTAGSALRAESELWGEAGEKWDPKGVLPDFSFAGYGRGEKTIPAREPELSVADHGAVAGGETDVTEAFREAITRNPGKCIGIPEGRFALSDRVRLTEPGTVLKGAGPGKTVLYFTRGLQEIEPTTATTGGGFTTNSWSWSGGLIVVGVSGSRRNGRTKIAETAGRGDKMIVVEDAGLFEPGESVHIKVKDNASGSLTDYLYRDDAGEDFLVRRKVGARQIARVVSIEENRITIDRPLRFDVRAEWEPVAETFEPKSHDIGLEGVTIEFPSRPYRGHWLEDGLNGVAVNGTNNWVKNIEIRNCDSGIYVKGQFNTVDGVVITGERKRHSSGNTGHHGLTVTGADCLVTNFEIDTKFYHDVTVSSGSIGNVFSHGSGEDLCFDHHRFAPYENLFTAIHLGEGTRPWHSGGTGGKGKNTASGAVFWNIDSEDRFSLPGEGFGPPGLVFVELNTGSVRKSGLPEGWHYEKLRGDTEGLADLHQAQRRRRLGEADAPGGPAESAEPEARQFHPWTNVDGVTIEARFLGLSADTVQLELRGGKRYHYPLSYLDGESRKLAESLAQAKGRRIP